MGTQEFTNPKQLFDHLKNALLSPSAQTKAKEVNARYNFDISGEGGGKWCVDTVSDPVVVTEELHPSPSFSMTVDAKDFVEMLKDPPKAMQLFMMGRIRISGDPILAMKLQKLFSLG